MNQKVLIAAGGTGGHIYPALAIAEAFLALRPDLTIEFVGTPSGLENKLIPAKGFKLHHLPIGRLNSNVPLKERVQTLVMLPFALIRAWLLLRRIKPVFVLGVGGYATGPVLLSAALTGYRSAIWEPNAMPGLANRWLARFVDECWVVFEDARNFLKSRHFHRAGMPVRREIEAAGQKRVGSGNKFRLLVFGGSQGARGINTCMIEMLRTGGDWLKDMEIVHQTGPADFERVKSAYAQLPQGIDVQVKEYLHDMADQYLRADLVVCRSGTGTLSELAACGRPAILIPFPFASDDHQRKNAESLVVKGAAEMILQKDLTPTLLKERIVALKSSPDRRAQMIEAVRRFHTPQAAEVLVKQFIERIDSHAPGAI